MSNFEKNYELIKEVTDRISKRTFENELYGKLLSRKYQDLINQAGINLNVAISAVESHKEAMAENNFLEFGFLQKKFLELINDCQESEDRKNQEKSIYEENINDLNKFFSYV